MPEQVELTKIKQELEEIIKDPNVTDKELERALELRREVNARLAAEQGKEDEVVTELSQVDEKLTKIAKLMGKEEAEEEYGIHKLIEKLKATYREWKAGRELEDKKKAEFRAKLEEANATVPRMTMEDWRQFDDNMWARGHGFNI